MRWGVGRPAGGLKFSDEWAANYRVEPSPLAGANGIRFSPDGRLYIAQFLSSQVSVVDPRRGTAHSVFAAGAGFIAPDDLAFDGDGVLFATEVMDGRISARLPDGGTRVVAADVPRANGITFHQGRLYVDEFRPDGRILEIYADKAPRVIAERVSMPNALCAGPDGFLYYPAVVAGEVWRVHPDHGKPELVIGGLAMPTSVKCSPAGHLVVTEAGIGRISTIDVLKRLKTSFANLRPGIDNCDFGPEGTLFVSHFIDGGVVEILGDGTLREVIAPGLLGPWGIGVDHTGMLYIADGMRLLQVDPSGRQRTLSGYTMGEFPGFLRNLIVLSDRSFIVATSAGSVVRWRLGEEPITLAAGLNQITGLATNKHGAVIVAESGTGRLLKVTHSNVSVIASGLGSPMGVICETDDTYVVSDARNGCLHHVKSEQVQTLVTGLQEPHGLVSEGDGYVVVDRGAKTLMRVAKSGTIEVLASNLPLGVHPGVKERVLPGTETLVGPLIGYSALATHRGSLFVGCDGDGSVLELRPIKTQ